METHLWNPQVNKGYRKEDDAANNMHEAHFFSPTAFLFDICEEDDSSDKCSLASMVLSPLRCGTMVSGWLIINFR